jgi:hypothetical protein
MVFAPPPDIRDVFATVMYSLRGLVSSDIIEIFPKSQALQEPCSSKRKVTSEAAE